MEYAIAVIDIGMTNKKVAVYDDLLRLLDSQYRDFEPCLKNGLPCHDLDAMEEWFINVLKTFADKYPIQAIAVSTHGATFVCIGNDGKAAVPCVLYTYEPGENFHKRFYERYGEADDLQASTGTPAFKALINPAKGIMFAKEQFSDEFKNVNLILPYPQYWGYRFTGTAGVESTYMGNHTYLWDQINNKFSSVSGKMGLVSLIPNKLYKSWDILGTINEKFADATGLSSDVFVTMGIHDSNSTMLPYFAKKGERGFILNSTGTWCVIMNPVKKYMFRSDELGKVVFFNISAFGTPIKTAIFLGGQEFKSWSRLFMKKHNRNDSPQWNEDLYRSIINEKNLFLMPELTPGSGQYPASIARIVEDGKNYYFNPIEDAVIEPLPDESSLAETLPPCFSDYEKCFAVLRLSLVMQTITTLERVGIENGHDIYIEGGFRRDESYNRVLSSAFASNKVYLTDIAEATSIGAAMTVKMAITGKNLHDLCNDFEIGYREQAKSIFEGLHAYREAWLRETEK
ncbi:MAG: FGGY family carbohydrate kinase [Treponema sp.]|nr:FGGY family carbohydrate kinase [Treponema sp.]